MEEEVDKQIIKKTLDSPALNNLLKSVTEKVMAAQQERLKLQGAADYFGEFEGVNAPNEKFKAIDTLLDDYSKISD